MPKLLTRTHGFGLSRNPSAYDMAPPRSGAPRQPVAAGAADQSAVRAMGTPLGADAGSTTTSATSDGARGPLDPSAVLAVGGGVEVPGAVAPRAATPAAAAAQFKIGALARRTGKTVRALHLYEELGLLEPASRSAGGFRLYGVDQVARVAWIGKLQDMGFSLAEIGELLADVSRTATAPEAMHRVRDRFRVRLHQTREQVARLMQLERDLSESLAYLEACRACDESQTADVCADCDEHHAGRHDTRAPDLVAGIHLRPSDRRTVDPAGLASGPVSGPSADRPVTPPHPKQGPQ